MTPEQYDAWYDTPRGQWIGNAEYGLVRSLMALQPGDTVLDVGCGTGRQGGSGAYRGAHWHTRAEMESALRALPVRNVRYHYGVFLASGSGIAHALERALPSCLPLGSLLAVAGDTAR